MARTFRKVRRKPPFRLSAILAHEPILHRITVADFAQEFPANLMTLGIMRCHLFKFPGPPVVANGKRDQDHEHQRNRACEEWHDASAMINKRSSEILFRHRA